MSTLRRLFVTATEGIRELPLRDEPVSVFRGVTLALGVAGAPRVVLAHQAGRGLHGGVRASPPS